MSRVSYSALVFDLDGTLFDLPVDWRAVRKDLEGITGAPMQRVSIFSAVRVIIMTNPQLRKRLFRSIDAHESVAAERALPINGATRLVVELSRRSRLGLVTMQGRNACSRVLERYGLLKSFTTILTREDSLERSVQLSSASRNLGVPPGEILFCGDKFSDLAAGRSVGMRVVIVGRKGRREWGSDFILPDVGGFGGLVGVTP